MQCTSKCVIRCNSVHLLFSIPIAVNGLWFTIVKQKDIFRQGNRFSNFVECAFVLVSTQFEQHPCVARGVWEAFASLIGTGILFSIWMRYHSRKIKIPKGLVRKIDLEPLLYVCKIFWWALQGHSELCVSPMSLMLALSFSMAPNCPTSCNALNACFAQFLCPRIQQILGWKVSNASIDTSPHFRWLIIINVLDNECVCPTNKLVLVIWWLVQTSNELNHYGVEFVHHILPQGCLAFLYKTQCVFHPLLRLRVVCHSVPSLLLWTTRK